MANQKDIRRRIKSIKNTKKITRAMEMVSAAKMKKAVSQVLAIRPYAEASWSVLSNLSKSIDNAENDLLSVREVKRALVIMVTSNRGLCGSFNSQVFKKVREEIQDPKNLRINRVGDKKIESKSKDFDVDFVVIGKKGEGMVKKLQKELVASFIEISHNPNASDVRPIAKLAIDDYRAEKYDKVILVYTDYVSPMVQVPKLRQLLPVSKVDLEKQIEDIENLAKEHGLEKTKKQYIVEPSSEEVLEVIFPRLVEMQIYHGILESKASEESSRMLAMKSATDAAGEMADSLTLTYNQLRQAKITQEISEISAGRVALED